MHHQKPLQLLSKRFSQRHTALGEGGDNALVSLCLTTGVVTVLLLKQVNNPGIKQGIAALQLWPERKENGSDN